MTLYFYLAFAVVGKNDHVVLFSCIEDILNVTEACFKFLVIHIHQSDQCIIYTAIIKYLQTDLLLRIKWFAKTIYDKKVLAEVKHSEFVVAVNIYTLLKCGFPLTNEK